MRILKLNYLVKILIPVFAVIVKIVQGQDQAPDVSVINVTKNETHTTTIKRYKDQEITLIQTDDSETMILMDLDKNFKGEFIVYDNGTTMLTIPTSDHEGRITRRTEEGSNDEQIIYRDNNNDIYLTSTEYYNGTVELSGKDGRTIVVAEEEDGTISTTASDKITITHPNGTKITTFKENDTIIEEDIEKVIVTDGKVVTTQYNDSTTVKVTDDEWMLNLAGDDEELNHNEL